IQAMSELLSGNTDEATAGRTTIWKNYLKGLSEKNVFGVGIQSSKTVYEGTYGINVANHTPHNIYILSIVEFGLVGLLLWLTFLIGIFKYSISLKSDRTKGLTLLF